MADDAKPKEQSEFIGYSDPVPPGATRKALDRPVEPPGTDAGERHAVAAPAGGGDITGLVGPEEGDTYDIEGQDPLENGPPYAGHAGGAVGGTPAEGRSTGGTVSGGLAPESGELHGDRTVGLDPDAGEPGRGKGKKTK